MSFKILDISGDIGIQASGASVEEIFTSAAEALYSLVTRTDKLAETERLEIELAAESIEALLVGFLNELIFHFDAKGFMGRRTEIVRLSPDNVPVSVKAMVWGERFSPERHERGLLVKAATYHRLKVAAESGRWTAEVIFDI